VKAEIEAVNKGQADIASSYFSDDAQIITSLGQPKGRAKIWTFMFNLIGMKEHDSIIELAADGANVTGKMAITNAELQNNSKETWGKVILMPVTLKAIVQDGRIISWEVGSAAK
jgi:ketosteroid isomerase-like protein